MKYVVFGVHDWDSLKKMKRVNSTEIKSIGKLVVFLIKPNTFCGLQKNLELLAAGRVRYKRLNVYSRVHFLFQKF